MPLKPFTLEMAKTKFARPVLLPFKEVEANNAESRYANATELSQARAACWQRLLNEQFMTRLEPHPFNGKYPTRIHIFKTESGYTRILTHYFGKRIRNFDFTRMLRDFSWSFKWLEFDREGLLMYYDFAANKNLVTNLASHYYPYHVRCGAERGTIYPVRGWRPNNQGYFRYIEPSRAEEFDDEDFESSEESNPT